MLKKIFKTLILSGIGYTAGTLLSDSLSPKSAIGLLILIFLLMYVWNEKG